MTISTVLQLADVLPKEKYFSQYLVTFLATLLLLSSGFGLGWSSPAIPMLLGPDAPFPVTLDESSWVVSFMDVGYFISAIPAAWMMDTLGRKKTLIIGVLPLIVAWLLIAFAQSVAYLYVARMLSGLTFGLCYSVMPMYLGEIASTKIRGSLIIMVTIMNKLGVLMVYAVGVYVSFRLLALICLIPPILFLLFSFTLPETPYYLLRQNQKDEARESLAKLRGHSEVHAELEQMTIAVEKSIEGRKGHFRELFYTRGNRRALIIIIGLTSIQILCGSQAIIGYSQTIFEKVGSDIQAGHVSIIFGLVQVLSATSSASIVDLVGRRPLLMISVIGTAICNFIVGGYFYMDHRMNMDMSSISWIPIVAIMVFIICYVIGMATVIYTILGEIFPSNLRAIAGGIYTITCSTYSFSVYKLFQVVSDGWGSDVSFFGFAMVGVIFTPFIWFFVPETKGKSLDDILEDLNKEKK